MKSDNRLKGFCPKKNRWGVLVIVLSLSVAAGAEASYVIRLKEGSRFITKTYWKEGDQVKFYSFGGIVGIEAHRIQTIDPSDLVPDQPIVEPDRAEKNPRLPETDGLKTLSTQSKSRAVSETSAMAAFKEKKDGLSRRLKDIQVQFEEANLSGDVERKQALKAEYSDIQKQLHAMKDELMKTNGGRLPDWWNATASR